MATGAIPRSREAEAFLTCLQDTPPRALTACAQWTAHDVGAHLAGACQEVLRHLRAHREGHALRRTRAFEEREAPFRQLAPAALLRSLEEGEEAVRSELAAILAAEPDAVVTWTRRKMRVDAFSTHLRSECALHRWDLVGDDATSGELLRSFELLQHAVTAIGAGPMTARGVAGGGVARSLRIGSDGQPDLVVGIGPVPSLAFAEPGAARTLTADHAARLLFLWGRTPQPPSRVQVTGRRDDAFLLRQLLAGY